MPTSPRHGFQKWSAGFTQSDTILNVDIDMLDVRLGLSVRSRTENAPLGGDVAGDCYIITGTPSGAFSAFTEDYVAFYDGSTWYEFEPVTGQVAWVDDDGQGVTFNGSAWTVTSKDLPLDKLDATAAPGVTNDVDEGYSVGSRWLDITADTAYICLDATDGAAVWKRIDNEVAGGVLNNFAATTDPAVGDDSGDGYAVGSRWINVTADRAYQCIDASVGAAIWRRDSINILTPTIADDSVYTYSFGADVFTGTLIVSCNSASQPICGIFAIRAAASSAFINPISSSNIHLLTGVLAGTTGQDGVVTISTHTNNNLYIENRSGGNFNLNLTINWG
jgi:hypothetical protein